MTQGGSTITQQLAKTSFLSSDRSLKRKLQEVIIAFWLEARLSKDQILSRYLSSVYFGDGAFGIRAAARVYFDKAPERLTLGEAAMLAGMVQAPSRLAPSRHLDEARERADLVLKAMVDTGAISRARAENAPPADYNPGRKALPSGSYFADWALPQARAALTEASYGDVAVKTTLDHDLQAQAERVIRDGIASARGLGVTQGALVAMRRDGRVVAIVGGTDYGATPFNRATQARRQPGSSFKLFVYLAALDAGMRPGDTVDDTPLTIGDYSPKNDEGKYRGRISLATAFAASSNVAAVRLAQQTGTAAVIAEARQLGVTSPISRYPAMALGTSPMTLLELTQAYAALAAGTRPITATAFERPHDSGFIASIRAAAKGLQGWPSRGPMLQLLQSAVRNGTGLAARLPVPAYGKTGTTQNHHDAWFVGFAGDLVVGVWVGNDNNAPMRGIVGGSLPASLWKRFMMGALAHDGVLKRMPDPEPGLGDMVRDIAGPDAGDAADAVGDAIGTIAPGGQIDPDAAAAAAQRLRDVIEARRRDTPDNDAPPPRE